jgi:hypothetical protein
MEQESIFEGVDIEPKSVSSFFRFAGILRLVVIFSLFIACVSFLISFGTVAYFKLIAEREPHMSWGEAMLVLIPLVLYIPMFFYYFPQVKYELQLSPKLFLKRRFRLYTIILNLIFILVLLLSYSVNQWHISISSSTGVLAYSIVLLFVSIVILDIRLFATQRRTVY